MLATSPILPLPHPPLLEKRPSSHVGVLSHGHATAMQFSRFSPVRTLVFSPPSSPLIQSIHCRLQTPDLTRSLFSAISPPRAPPLISRQSIALHSWPQALWAPPTHPSSVSFSRQPLKQTLTGTLHSCPPDAPQNVAGTSLPRWPDAGFSLFFL